MDCIPRVISLLALMVPTIGFVRSGVLPQIGLVRCVATTILDAGWLGDDLRGFSDITGDSLMSTSRE